MRRSARAATVLVAGLVLSTAAGCGSSSTPGPNADASGLFPPHYPENGNLEGGGTLITATAATASTRTYTFSVDVPPREAFALVANCTSGRVAAVGARIECTGDPVGLLGLCAGRHMDITVHVSSRQRRRWGLALYRTPRCNAGRH